MTQRRTRNSIPNSIWLQLDVTLICGRAHNVISNILSIFCYWETLEFVKLHFYYLKYHFYYLKYLEMTILPKLKYKPSIDDNLLSNLTFVILRAKFGGFNTKDNTLLKNSFFFWHQKIWPALHWRCSKEIIIRTKVDRYAISPVVLLVVLRVIWYYDRISILIQPTSNPSFDSFLDADS